MSSEIEIGNRYHTNYHYFAYGMERSRVRFLYIFDEGFIRTKVVKLRIVYLSFVESNKIGEI